MTAIRELKPWHVGKWVYYDKIRPGMTGRFESWDGRFVFIALRHRKHAGSKIVKTVTARNPIRLTFQPWSHRWWGITCFLLILLAAILLSVFHLYYLPA
jgi:hypothetical protein